MKKIALTALLLGWAAATAFADDTPPPSAQVQTQQPRQGKVPRIVVAYGTAEPTTFGSLTISLPSDGRVLRLDVTPGEAVRAGQHLVEFGFSPQLISTRNQAMTAVVLARKELIHINAMLKQQLATRDQLAQAEKAVGDAEAGLKALPGGGADKTTIIAPFDGIVTTVPVNQGDRVAANTNLLTLSRQNGVAVTVGIDPAARAQVRVGQSVALSPVEPGGMPATGTLERIDSILNPKTRLIDGDVVVTSSNLLNGEGFRAVITTGEYEGWLVPQDAINNDGKGSFVFQIVNGKAARIDVAILGTANAQAAVKGNIDPSHPLVVVGNYQLEDGIPVRVDGQGS